VLHDLALGRLGASKPGSRWRPDLAASLLTGHGVSARRRPGLEAIALHTIVGIADAEVC